MVFNLTGGVWKLELFGKYQMKNFTVLVELLFVMGIDWIIQVRNFYFES